MKKIISGCCQRLILYLKKVFMLTTRQTIYVCVAAMFLATAVTAENLIVSTHYRSMEISLNYDGAQHGLTPSSGRFDIAKIKSDEVIQSAIDRVNDPNLTVENVKPRITIDAKMPKSAVDKAVTAVSNGESYSYTPAEFVVYYSQKDKLGKNYTVEFLNALAESYTDFFKNTYSDKNTVLQFEDGSAYENYDYDEISHTLTDTVNSMINYLGQQQEKSANFVSTETGCKYSELVTALENLRDINIEKLNAYIQQNKVSKNKDMFLNKKKYLIDHEYRNYDYLNGASMISNKSLSIYDAKISGVAFVPTVDDNNEFYMSRTKTGIDNLSKISYQNGTKAVECKKTIDEYRDQYDKFSAAAPSTDEMHQTADALVKEIETNLKKISDLSIRTDDEYIAKKNNNYISVVLPGKLNLPIVSWVKYGILFLIILVAGIRVLRAFKQLLRRKFSSKEGTEK